MATASFRVRTGSAPTGAAFLAALVVFAPAIVPVASASESSGAAVRRVAVLAADAGDARIAMVEEAVSFWNGAASGLGAGAVFADPEFVMPPADARPALAGDPGLGQERPRAARRPGRPTRPPRRAPDQPLAGAGEGDRVHAVEAGLRPFENYAHQLSRLAGRLHASGPGPAPPEALFAVEAEVVVLLSVQNLMPFAWPYGEGGRYFVAVPAGEERENVLRNVIAHELGHVLGLKHLAEPGVLMCQPCDTSTAISRDQAAGPSPATAAVDQPRFLPLTDLDRERLRTFLAEPDQDDHLDP